MSDLQKCTYAHSLLYSSKNRIAGNMNAPFFLLFSILLKGHVTFLKLCLLEVCLVLIIPRYAFFFMNNRFQAEKCLCQHSLFLRA